MYNEELKRRDSVIASLKDALIKMNDRVKNDVRREIISFILDSQEFSTEQDKQNVTDILANSNISIDSIKQTYGYNPTRTINNSSNPTFYI